MTAAARTLRLLPTVGMLVWPAALLIVLLGDNEYHQFVAGLLIINALSALGLDWLMGRAGVVSLGNGAIMAFGALFAGGLAQHSWASFPVTLVIVTVLGGLLGAIISIPSGRLRHVYFALVTLALQVIVVFAGRKYQASNESFLSGIPLPPPTVGTQQEWLLLLSILLGVTVFLLQGMYRRQPGRMWMAVRESETAARVIGVESRRWKLAAFVGSSALISLAGGLLAYYTGRVSADSFTLTFAISFVVMVIVGGLRSINGALLGATIVTVIPEILGSYADNAELGAGGFSGWFQTNVFYINSGLFGVLVLVVLLYLPRGIVPSLSTLVQRLEARAGSAPARPAGDVTRPAITPAAEDGDALLRIRDLRVTYRNGAQALTGIDLDVGSGEALAIVGRNGVGKTTLMRTLAGFFRSEGVQVRGRAVFDGVSLVGVNPVKAARLGITLVPERDKVFPDLTVAEHLTRIGDLDAARAALPNEWPMLESKWRTQAGLLSGGERQILALATAASLRPRLLLIDEMSLGLSPVAVDRVVAAIVELRAATDQTLIVVEQNIEVASRLTERILLMEAGALLGEAPPAARERTPVKERL